MLLIIHYKNQLIRIGKFKLKLFYNINIYICALTKLTKTFHMVIIILTISRPDKIVFSRIESTIAYIIIII